MQKQRLKKTWYERSLCSKCLHNPDHDKQLKNPGRTWCNKQKKYIKVHRGKGECSDIVIASKQKRLGKW